MSKLSLVLLVGVIAIVALLLKCQDQGGGGGGGGNPPAQPALFPGEVRKPGFDEPIIVDVADRECKEDTTCPSKEPDCVTKNFTVQKDTTYRLLAVYYNGDTLTASCRLCATIYEGNTVLVDLETACPTGGSWQGFANLKPGHTYTLSTCLHHCPNAAVPCNCGEIFYSLAAVSIRDLVPQFKRVFR